MLIGPKELKEMGVKNVVVMKRPTVRIGGLLVRSKTFAFQDRQEFMSTDWYLNAILGGLVAICYTEEMAELTGGNQLVLRVFHLSGFNFTDDRPLELQPWSAKKEILAAAKEKRGIK